MESKFPVINFLIKLFYLVGFIILGIGIILIMSVFSNDYSGLIDASIGVFALLSGIGVSLTSIVPFFFAELLKILIAIEKNTRK